MVDRVKWDIFCSSEWLKHQPILLITAAVFLCQIAVGTAENSEPCEAGKTYYSEATELWTVRENMRKIISDERVPCTMPRYVDNAISTISFCRLMASYNLESVLSEACRPSVVRPSVTIVHFGQTAMGSWFLHSLTGLPPKDGETICASTWVRQAPNSIEIGLAVFGQWQI